MYADAFGRAHLGTIDAVAHGLGILSLGLGPVIFALARDMLGSYRPVLLGLAVVCGGTTLLLVAVRGPGLPPRSVQLGATQGGVR